MKKQLYFADGVKAAISTFAGDPIDEIDLGDCLDFFVAATINLDWDSGANEFFQFYVCSPLGIEKVLENQPAALFPYYVVMASFAADDLIEIVQSVFDACRCDDEEKYMNRLSHFFKADFDWDMWPLDTEIQKIYIDRRAKAS